MRTSTYWKRFVHFNETPHFGIRPFDAPFPCGATDSRRRHWLYDMTRDPESVTCPGCRLDLDKYAAPKPTEGK